MSEETKETTEMVEVPTGDVEVIENYQPFEVEQFVDDAVSMGIIDAYVYSFKQGGREVTGLTARAIEHICLEHSPKISISAYNIEKDDTEVTATATARMVFRHPAKTETKPDGTVLTTEGYEEEVTAPGVRTEPLFTSNGRRDPHAEQKTLTKACRAARRQLISQAAQIKAKKDLLALQGGKPSPVPQAALPSQQPSPDPNTQAPAESSETQKIDVARKAAFAKYGERKAELESMGIDEEILTIGVYKFYKVESRKDMNEGQYRNFYAALDLPNFANWIQNLVPKTDPDESFRDDALEGPNA